MASQPPPLPPRPRGDAHARAHAPEWPPRPKFPTLHGLPAPRVQPAPKRESQPRPPVGVLELKDAVIRVSEDLDIQGEVIEEVAGKVDSLEALVIAVGDDVRGMKDDVQDIKESFNELLKLVQKHIMPAIDRIDEIEEVLGTAAKDVVRLRTDFENRIKRTLTPLGTPAPMASGAAPSPPPERGPRGNDR